MPRPAQPLAVVFALTFAATPAFAATASSQAATNSGRAPERAEHSDHRANLVPQPHAPQRLPLKLRRQDAEFRPDRFDGPVQAKEAWFDDQGLQFDAGGLAYKVRF